MIRFWPICRNTFVQTIRQPIYGILILVTFAVLVISVPLTGWTMSTNYHASDQKMLESMGLSTLLVSGLLVAAFSASSVLSREIEDKTALTVISKPVSRATFVAGKFAGVAGAVATAFYLASLAFLMTVRHRVMPAAGDPYDWPVIVLGLTALGLAILAAGAGNYFFGWTFISASVWSSLVLMSLAMGAVVFIGKGWTIVPPGHDTVGRVAIHSQLLIGIMLTFMAVLIFVAVAVAASTRLGQVMTLLVCGAVFFLGAMHQYLFDYWARQIVAARILGWTVPRLTYFFALDALIAGRRIPAGYVAGAAAYCAVYVAAVLAIGMALFQRRQLEEQGAASTMPGAVALLAWTGRAVAIAAGLAVLVIASWPAFHNVTGAALAFAVLIGAAANWMIWSGFGRGARWAYRLAGVLAVVSLCALGAAAAFSDRLGIERAGPVRVLAVAGAILAAMVICILLFPKTRHHFQASR